MIGLTKVTAISCARAFAAGSFSLIFCPLMMSRPIFSATRDMASLACCAVDIVIKVGTGVKYGYGYDRVCKKFGGKKVGCK